MYISALKPLLCSICNTSQSYGTNVPMTSSSSSSITKGPTSAKESDPIMGLYSHIIHVQQSLLVATVGTGVYAALQVRDISDFLNSSDNHRYVQAVTRRATLGFMQVFTQHTYNNPC